MFILNTFIRNFKNYLHQMKRFDFVEITKIAVTAMPNLSQIIFLPEVESYAECIFR